MIARPTDEEIAELMMAIEECRRMTFLHATTQAHFVAAETVRQWRTRLLALVTQEGGDSDSQNPRPTRQTGPDKSPPARSVNAPERATSGGPFEYSEVCRHGFTGSCPICGAFPRTAPAPLPEGMETTREQHDVWAGFTGDQYNWQTITALVRDLRRALAEIARLTDALAEADDMAEVGRSLMEKLASLKSHAFLQDWAPAQDPAEIVADLLNELDEVEQRAREEERKALAELDILIPSHVSEEQKIAFHKGCMAYRDAIRAPKRSTP